MQGDERLRIAGVGGLLAMAFMMTALLASSIPLTLVLGTSVHGLSLADYATSQRRLAPLSPRIIGDARTDSGLSPDLSIGQISDVPPATTFVAAAPAAKKTVPTPSPTAIATPVPAGRGTVIGTVLDSSTRVSLPSATITLNPGARVTTSDSSGSFGFVGLSPGTYDLTASILGYQLLSMSISLNGSLRLTLRLTSLTLTGSVGGTVKDVTTGNPIAGATVTLSPGNIVAITDASGAFLFSSIQVGSYTATASASGFSSASQPVTVRWGKTANLSLKLR
jgi:hypothetical protein